MELHMYFSKKKKNSIFSFSKKKLDLHLKKWKKYPISTFQKEEKFDLYFSKWKKALNRAFQNKKSAKTNLG